MSPPREPSTPLAALHALLVDLFSADELRRWLRYGPDADLLPELPEGGSVADLADRVLGALERRGRIGNDFFERLEVERPYRKAAIAVAAEHWAAASTTRQPARPGEHRDSRLWDEWRGLVSEELRRPWLVLRGVDGEDVELDRVYTEVRLLVRGPAPGRVLGPGQVRCADNGTDKAEGDAEDVHGEPQAVEQSLDLLVWLQAPEPKRTPLVIEGEVGTGKSELLRRAARALAEESRADAPLLLRVDAKDLGDGSLVGSLCRSSSWDDSKILRLLKSDARFIVMIDSLDEGERSLPDLIADVHRTLGPRLHRLVLAMRCSQRRALRDVDVARIVPWSGASVERFLRNWERVDPSAVAALRNARTEGALAELLATPLTATFCALVARDRPRALGNRTHVFHEIITRILRRNWPALSRGRTQDCRWSDLQWLESLALVRLREHPSGLSQAMLGEYLHQVDADDGKRLLSTLESLGVLLRTSSGFDFAYRWLAEYLAGRALRVEPSKVGSVAEAPWSFEALRHAIVGAREGASGMISALLPRCDEIANDAPRMIRRVQLAAVVAADLRDEVPETQMSRIAEVIWNCLSDETSIWIPSETARFARHLARAGGRVWKLVEPRILHALQRASSLDGRVVRWYSERGPELRALWISLLRHRDPHVCCLAIERLRSAVDVPEVLASLLRLVLDDRHPGPSFPLCQTQPGHMQPIIYEAGRDEECRE
jgi:hypothetical protein